MKKWNINRGLTLVLASIGVGLSGTSWAQSSSSSLMHNVNVTTDLTLASKYMTDGFKVGGDHAVWQPSLGLSLPISGLSVQFWSAIQTERTNKQFDELDLFARYQRTFFSGNRGAFNLHGFYDYWLYPNPTVVEDGYGSSIELPTRRGNKLSAGVSFPELIPIAGSYLVPTYNAYYWLYWAQNRSDQFQGGARHEVQLQYFHDIPKIISGTQQYLGCTSSASYHDGAFGVRPSWTHSIVQLTSGLYALKSLFTVSVNKQWSFQDSVNPTDELWSTLSFTKVF